MINNFFSFIREWDGVFSAVINPFYLQSENRLIEVMLSFNDVPSHIVHLAFCTVSRLASQLLHFFVSFLS